MTTVFKKRISVLLTIALTFCFASSINAEEPARIGSVVSQSTEYYDDGSYSITTIYQNPYTRSGRSGSKNFDFYDSGSCLWTLTVFGSFIYGDGGARCTGASVDYSIADSTWQKTSTSSSYSGNTATAYGSFSKNNGHNVSTSVSLSCDANGNLF